jgi:hypothetical protein
MTPWILAATGAPEPSVRTLPIHCICVSLKVCASVVSDSKAE